jgi:lipopolysaccharide transport system ATP-binding protein
MNNKAIVVNNLSKRYRIGVKDVIHDSLATTIVSWLKAPFSNYKKLRSLSEFDESGDVDDVIWALRDLSFEVAEGEVLGIIGKNGAGKSTLLKILSRITNPTSGTVRISGRVSSLLEVGTGFHPELTGRENVYLNGTIIGMSKKEIDRKFDEIVNFSGVEKFIDTPIKRYSSGMAVRLAFAVAAHIEPEILIIDEVLAVGDAEFQKKCLGKMQSVGREGRTVLFVSHNMLAINQLCKRVVWLEDGKKKMSGSPQDIIAKYLSQGTTGMAEWVNQIDDSLTYQEVVFRSVRILSEMGEPSSVFEFDSSMNIEIKYVINNTVKNLTICYQLYNSQGIIVYESLDTDIPEYQGIVREKGSYKSTCHIAKSFLLPDRYTVSVSAFIDKVKLIAIHESILTFDISEVGYTLNPERLGVVAPVFEWKVKRLHESNIKMV